MSAAKMNPAGDAGSFDLIRAWIESLSGKMDKLIHIQQKVLSRLDGMSQDIDDIENDMENLKVDKEEIHLSPGSANPGPAAAAAGGEVREICQEMSSIVSAVNRRSEQQAQKLEGMEKLVLSMQQVIGFIGETVKRSRVAELMCKGPAARKGPRHKDGKGKQAIRRKSSADAINRKPDKLKDHKGKDGTEKTYTSLKDLRSQKKKFPEKADHIPSKKQALLLEEVQKLNKENAEKSDRQLTSARQDSEANRQAASIACDTADSQVSVDETQEVAEKGSEEEGGETDGVTAGKETRHDVEDVVEEKAEETHEAADEMEKSTDQHNDASSSPSAEQEVKGPSIMSFVTEEHFVVEEYAQGQESETKETEKEDEEGEQGQGSEGWAIFTADGVEIQLNLKQMLEKREKESADGAETEDDADAEQFFIDTAPPPAAPFSHRIVSAKPNQISNFYAINWQEVLGGGRFGQVHKCVENSSGLTLAAKVIKARNQKEKEVVKNEIQVMNNLDHANLIQLYAAYETRNDVILVLEYVGGGELFDRIIDENYTLMELDAVVFIRQICDGLQHMHKMYVLHLDLKPENILCVNRVTNKIKIIDFGLARIYKPREKLKVNFGTPEFLAPEVINYDFVSFNTDMWSLGVITYMLLSSLCPFLGDDDSQTMNNILACQWNFEEQEFIDTSEEAKDFISRLLIVNKSWRMSASEALRHPWLSDPALHHRLHTKKTMCRSRRSSCVPLTDS
ncbi:myosin light chain kinase 2, skeletal/cardiac muscle isoform X2 [Betta splendens]|uniref:Myosin light chain kinase 2, skeletal/cardiac muscle isoform X2 n=1 Tax=Betta splendens TaxID=158456 RepID=A0A6P7L460_BETSP|nr:myosin light chain kinase 2, skeletal/cardiac muscle isoform X2 [Betta splendens]